jgi:hypothetical protein
MWDSTATFPNADMMFINSTNIYLSVADSDTGWAEAINPNADEVKAFMNGWKATANNGTRYTSWVSAVDGTTAPASQTIDFVKNNVAPGYEGYRLHYKLATPEIITDINCNVEGDMWQIEPGDNYITLDSGIVLGEVANPYYNGTAYWINIGISPYESSRLRNKAESINAIYKNGILDSGWTKQVADAYGLDARYRYPADFDVNATYTVDYKILATIAPQISSSMTASIPQSVYKAIASLGEAIKGKQDKSSILDNTINLSMYERIVLGTANQGVDTRGTRSYWVSPSETSIVAYINFKVPKTTIPIVTIESWSVWSLGGTGVPTTLTSADLLNGAPTVVYACRDYCIVRFTIKPSTNADNALSYGCGYRLTIVADCKQKI